MGRGSETRQPLEMALVKYILYRVGDMEWVDAEL